MILGIDLGTSNSMAAIYKEGKPVIIESRVGRKQIPSIVSIDENGYFFAGDVAKERLITYPNQTVSGFKRSMGTEKTFLIDGKELKAVELSTIILRNIKEDAESFLEEEITDVVICVPAFFNNPQRKAVLRAGELAGFKVKRLINEPTAAAIAYGVQDSKTDENTKDEQKVIIVLDLGGGTFDISVMEITDNVMEVIAVCGDNHLGGGDFTKRLIDLFLLENSIKETLTVKEEAKLWNQAEKAKRQITREGRGEIRCVINQVEYVYHITEEEYEKACMDLLEKIRKLTLKAVKESKYEPEEVQDIIMVGGGTKLSIVRKVIEKMAGKTLDYKITPDEAVAVGAAIQGALLEKDKEIKNLVMTDICPYYIGVNRHVTTIYDNRREFDVIIPKNTTIPAKRTVSYFNTPGARYSNILQSQDKYGIKETSLGEINFVVPDLGTKEKIECQISITYDNNGIIYTEAYIPCNGARFETLIKNDTCELTTKEAKEYLDNLQLLDMGRAENKEDNLLIERAESLYSEYLGKDRERINYGIMEFESALNTGKVTCITEARERLIKILEFYEKSGGLE